MERCGARGQRSVGVPSWRGSREAIDEAMLAARRGASRGAACVAGRPRARHATRRRALPPPNL